MRPFKAFITAGVLSVLASTVCHAQLGGAAPLPEIVKPAGPSLEETKQWIVEKFASLPAVNSTYPDENIRYVVSFDDCAMTITGVLTGFGTPSLNIAYLQLRDLNVNDFSIPKYVEYTNLTLRTLGEIDVVRQLTIRGATLADKGIIDRFPMKSDYVGSSHNGWGETVNGKQIYVSRQLHNLLWIKLKDVEVAESMSNAFKHAVTLCQQKAADEKAAQPAKKKELF